MATDQEIRDAGFKYVPQQKYLLNPFELPENQEPVTNSGIVNTNAFTNMGGGSGGALQVGDPMMNFDNFSSKLEAFSPLSVLSRGYTVSTKDDELLDNTELTKGDEILTRTERNLISSKITKIDEIK